MSATGERNVQQIENSETDTEDEAALIRHHDTYRAFMF